MSITRTTFLKADQFANPIGGNANVFDPECNPMLYSTMPENGFKGKQEQDMKPVRENTKLKRGMF